MKFAIGVDKVPTSPTRPAKGTIASFESNFIGWLSKVLPLGILRHLPSLYYRINRYRFRLFSRPAMVKETSKAKARRQADGFFKEYFIGQGIDVGYGGDLVTPNCRGWDIEHGDAQDLVGVDDESYDFVYSSHIIEHLDDPARAIRNWWRVVKPGGHLILYLPERDLFERKLTLPSTVSLDHKHYFLLDRDDPPDTIGLIPLIERNLAGAKIVYKKICDAGYDPDAPVRFMSTAEYSIEVVVRKDAAGSHC